MNGLNVNFNAELPVAEKPVLSADMSLHDKVVAVIKSIYDPELPVNIYDLGLIYDIAIDGQNVAVMMTLTTPNCPVAGSMPAKVECAIREIDDVEDACVELTWDPPWTPDKLSDEVKLALGLL